MAKQKSAIDLRNEPPLCYFTDAELWDLIVENLSKDDGKPLRDLLKRVEGNNNPTVLAGKAKICSDPKLKAFLAQ